MKKLAAAGKSFQRPAHVRRGPSFQLFTILKKFFPQNFFIYPLDKIPILRYNLCVS